MHHSEFLALVADAADLFDRPQSKYFELPSAGARIENDHPRALSRTDEWRISARPRLRDSQRLPPWAMDLRELLKHASDTKLPDGRSLLHRLCAIGVRHARASLASRLSARLREQLAPQARAKLEAHLHKRLVQATKPCFDVYLEASRLASCSVAGSPRRTKTPGEQFSINGHSVPLERLFRSFPALARLWLTIIRDWRLMIVEFSRRLDRDQRSIERIFFGDSDTGPVLDLTIGLSEPHRGGRTVIALQFAKGRLIYKPRSGHGEREWFNMLRWMNNHGFQLSFQCARTLLGVRHSWMESFEPAPCKSTHAAKRFYQRLGAMIYVAHSFRMVDCHRDNLIAAGEHPMLIDGETFFHPIDSESGETNLSVLFRTGFLPLPRGAPGAQYPSSPLCGKPGPHNPTLNGTMIKPSEYREALLRGFGLAQSFLVQRRRSHARRIARLRKLRWRWLPRATVRYLELCEHTIQPGALCSPVARALTLAKLCGTPKINPATARREISAIARLDVPYFSHRPTRLGRKRDNQWDGPRLHLARIKFF
jgi:hypothetical protein